MEFKPGPDYQTEEDLHRAAAEIGTTIFHPAGTCRMGQGRGRWWTAQLRVHGIPGLRIADASIMPSLTSGNTCSPVLVIAEKAAQMIFAERTRAQRGGHPFQWAHTGGSSGGVTVEPSPHLPLRGFLLALRLSARWFASKLAPTRSRRKRYRAV